MIVLVDFGSQTAHLIARRVRDMGVPVEIVEPEDALTFIKRTHPKGVILSGGPLSVYEEGAPTIDPEIYTLDIPLLAICYGMQLTMKLLGGEVVPKMNEYGPSVIRLAQDVSRIQKNLPTTFTVWMSHGDGIKEIPGDFKAIGQTPYAPYAMVEDEKRKIIGLLFHPEVEHTEHGLTVLKNFVDMCNVSPVARDFDIEKLEGKIKEKVGDSYVIGAVSGGVDSTVAAALTARAIGEQFIPIYVENGLMRAGTKEHVENIFRNIGIQADIVECEEEMLKRLEGVEDPEEKRKIIGNFYVEIFEQEMKKLQSEGKDVKFLMQGTIYSDVIESKGTKYADKIKSHHNVGGLPEHMKLDLLEPVREFYKDEVREIGLRLGLPESFIYKQPFPGPGYGVRIRGEVTKERLEKERQADVIVLEELEQADLLQKVFISFPVMTGAFSTAVKGDGRFFGEVIALRIVESRDVMTAVWSHVPYEVLQKISTRIMNEVQGISRVVYDITTKPPATMEWE
jgi:GMP synthase (glutamine-hydrolysing)